MTELKGSSKLAEVLENLIIAMSEAMPVLNAMYNHFRELGEAEKA